MATQVSSLIGADLSGIGGSTALFALGSVAYGTQGSEWQYVEVTSTNVTGKVLTVNPNGTAKVMMSAMLTANATGIDLAFAQNLINAGEFAWVAKRGRGMYVLCSASFTAGAEIGVGIGANSGRLVPASAADAGATILGVYINSSVGTADYAPGVPTVATLTWPRTVRAR